MISSSPLFSSLAGGPSTLAGGPSRLPEDEVEREGDLEEAPELVRQQTSTSYRVGYAPPRRMARSAASVEVPADDTWSCVIVILTFWFFVSMTLIMGIFGSEDLQLGPYSSVLLQPHPLFVQYLKTETENEMKVAPVLYAFYKAPPLEVAKMWSESLSASIRPETHEEWVYYLNEGSQINISYNVPNSSPLVLVIAKGIEGMAEWLEDPSYAGNALSWNLIHGSGTISLDILKPSDYYVAVGNFNTENVEVELNMSIRSSMYNVTDSYYKCNLTRGSCSLKLLFPGGNAAVLTTRGPLEGVGSERLYVKLSFEPRWMTYFLGIGGMTSIMLWAFNFLNRFRRNNEDTREDEAGDWRPERAPLLSQKDDDLSSLGSSYDSGSQNDEDPQECLEEGLSEGRSIEEGGKKYYSRQLCVICYDAPKNCFFIPCGHCSCCFTCATRIADAATTCPICRRRIKKVRRIYDV